MVSFPTNTLRSHVYLVIILLSSLQRLLLFQGNNLLAGGDLVPLLSPATSTSDLLYVWNEVNLGGLRVTAPRLLSPFGLSEAFGQLSGLGLATGEAIFLVSMYALAAISIYYLWPTIFRQAHWQASAFAAAIAYVYSPYLIADGIQTSVRFAVQYALVPFFLLLFARGLTRRDMRYSIVIGLVSPLIFSDFPGFQVAGYVAVTCSLFLFYHVLRIKIIRFSAFFTSIAVICSILVNLWWILPVFTNLGSYSSALTISPIDFAAQVDSSLSQTFRFLGKWSFYSSFKGVSYIPYSDSYNGNILSILLSFAPVALAFCAVILKPRNRTVLFCGWATVIGFFLTKGINAPFGNLYQLLLENVPLFRVYRESFYLLQIAVIPTSLLIGATFGAIIEWVNRTRASYSQARANSSFRYWKSYLAGILFLALVVASSWPLATGTVSLNPLTPSSHGVEIPISYSQFIQWINQDRQTGDFKVLVLPQRGLYSAYDWGYQGGNLLFSSLSNVILGGGSEYIASPDSQWAADLLYQAFYSNSSTFRELLSMTGVKYVLLESDFNTTFYQLPSIALNKAMLATSGLLFQEEFGALLLYRNPQFSGDIYLPRSTLRVAGTLDNPSGTIWQDDNFTSGWSVEKWGTESTQSSVVSHELSISLESSGSYIAGSIVRLLPPLPPSVSDLTIRFATNEITSMSVEVLTNATSYYPNTLNPPDAGQVSSTQGATEAYELNPRFGAPQAVRIWITNYFEENSMGKLVLTINYLRLSESIGSPSDVINLLANSTSGSPPSFILQNQDSTVSLPLSNNPNSFNSTIVSVTKHDPTNYDVELSLSGETILVLGETYSKGWTATTDKQVKLQHFEIDGFANAWRITGSGSVKVHLEFQPQNYVVYGGEISIVSFFFMIVFLLIEYRWGGRGSQNKTVKISVHINSDSNKQF